MHKYFKNRLSFCMHEKYFSEREINVQFSVRYTLYTVIFIFDLYSANNLNSMLNMNIFIKN